MGMFDDYNVFPTLKTKRILIAADGDGDRSGDETVTVHGLLSTKVSKRNMSTWLGTSKFTQYVKVTFAVIPDHLNDGEFSRIYNPDTRFDNDHSLTQFRRDYISNSITLDEILQNDYAASVSATDLESNMEVNDLFFELKINMGQRTRRITRRRRGRRSTQRHYYDHNEYWDEEQKWLRIDDDGFNSWILVGFIHFDYEQFQQDYSPVEHLKKLGGNYTSDLLLERSTSTSGEQHMRVPSTVNAFFYAEAWPRGSLQVDLDGDGTTDPTAVEAHAGEPYFGLTYYRSEGNLVDTYTGYVGGQESDPGPLGPKLNIRRVLYQKVVANHLLAPPVSGENWAMGWFHDSYDVEGDSPTPNMNRAQDLSLTSGVDLKAKIDVLGRDIKTSVNSFKRLITQKRKKLNSNILFKWTASGITMLRSPNGVIKPESNHTVVAWIDFQDFLSIHSPLGWLFGYHAPFSEGENISPGNPQLLQKFMDASLIKKLTITRKRLTNNPEGNILTSSPDYITYDTDEIPKHLLTTADTLPARPGENSPGLAAVGDLEEGDPASLLALGQSGTGRGFCLKDYDLFHNVSYGNYEYDADITILDGIKQVLESRVNAYYKHRDRMSEYFSRATVPATYADEVTSQINSRENYATNLLQGFSDPSESKKTREVVSGFHDYKTNTYTERFKTLARIHQERIHNFIKAFVDCYMILERVSPNNDARIIWLQYIEEKVQIFLNPSPGQPEIYLGFFDSVVSILESVLDRGNISKYERITSGLLVTSLDTSKENRLLNVCAKIPELVTAFGRTQIFYEPSVGNAERFGLMLATMSEQEDR